MKLPSLSSLSRLPHEHGNKLLIASALLTLLALTMMVWSVLQPTPLPVMLAMSVGQVLGTAAFAIYGWVVFIDLVRKRRAARTSLPPPVGELPPSPVEAPPPPPPPEEPPT